MSIQTTTYTLGGVIMNIVSNDSVHKNLQWMAAAAMSDAFRIIKAFLFSVLCASEKTIVSSCFEIINTESLIIYTDDDIEYLSIIAYADNIKSQYIKYLVNEKVDDDVVDRMLGDVSWTLFQFSHHFEGFRKACLDEVMKIISSRRDGIEKKKALAERVNERREEQGLPKYELPPVQKVNADVIAAFTN